MDLFIEPLRDKKGKLVEKSYSQYNPSEAIKERIAEVMRDYGIADNVRNNTYEEFDNLDLIDYVNECQVRFNENTPSGEDDPSDSWKSNIVKPFTRNKVRNIVAQVTQSILFPSIIAQNRDNEEDREMAEVMKDVIEYVLEQDNYSEKFIDIATNMAVYPGECIYQGFSQVKRKVKEILDNGDYTIKEVVDEIYSGFKLMHVPIEDFYIANIYESDLQKQPFIVYSRIIDYSEAEVKYGHLEDFKYVVPGVRVGYADKEDTFFDRYDDNLQNRLVTEDVYYNRSADLELVLVGGVLVHGDPERPMQRKDKMYPFAFNGYERISSRFFYFKPLVQNLKGIQDELDIMHRMIIDGTYLSLMPPLAVYGEENIDNSVFIPGSVHPFGPDTQVSPIQQGTNLNAGLSVLSQLESEGTEVSASELAGGAPLPGDRTKFEIARIEQNAAIKLGLFGKRISFLIRDIGRLLVGSVTQHMPFTEVMEVSGDDARVSFASIMMKDRNVKGETMDRRIEFTNQFPESEEELQAAQLELLNRSTQNKGGKLVQTQTISQVNPDAFKRMKYLVKVEPNFTSRQIELEKRVAFYDRTIQNPFINQEENTRAFIKHFLPGEEEKLLKKQKNIAEELQNAPAV